MMIASNVPYLLHYKFFRHTITTATLLNRIISVQLNSSNATYFNNCNRELPNRTQSLRTWDEAEVVKFKTKFIPKLENCGEFFMFVGYSESQNDGVY